MAIVQDATSKAAATTGALTWSHTCTGANRLLLVGGASVNDVVDAITGITYNSIAMTRVDSAFVSSLGFRIYLYYLLAPATGANNIVVSATNASRPLQFQGLSYTGVRQSGQPDAEQTGVATATSITDTLTTVASGSIHLMYVEPDASAINASTGTFVFGPGSPGTDGFYISNPTPVSPAGSNSIQVSGAPVQNWVEIGSSWAPVPDPARGAFLLNMI